MKSKQKDVELLVVFYSLFFLQKCMGEIQLEFEKNTYSNLADNNTIQTRFALHKETDIRGFANKASD